MIQVLFLGFAGLLVACSLMVILHRNPVTSALFLVLAFCALAGVYLLLHAEFVAMVQVIVYAGAIMVLFLFVIMYLNLRRDVEHGVHIALRRGAGWVLGVLLLTEGWLMFGRRWAPGPMTNDPSLAAPIGNTQAIGQALYTRYLFPFEITSMLLLVAMIGAVVIAKGRGPHAGGRGERAAAATGSLVATPGPGGRQVSPETPVADAEPPARSREPA